MKSSDLPGGTHHKQPSTLAWHAVMIELSIVPRLWQNAGPLGLLNPVSVARNNDLATDMLL